MTAVSFGVPFCVGNNVSLAAMKPITLNATGGVTLGTQIDLKTLNVWDMFEMQADANLALIKPSDQTVANYVLLYDDWEVRIGEKASGANALGTAGGLTGLETLWNGYNYIRAQVQTRNPWATASVSNLTVYGIRSHFERHYVEGEQTLVLVLKPVGIAPEWTTGTPSI